MSNGSECADRILTNYSENIIVDFNTLRPRQNGRRFADDIFKCIFLNENVWIPIKISLKFVPRGPISNIPALVQIMAWRRPGDKPLSEAMTVNLLTHICVTRPQWAKVKIHSLKENNAFIQKRNASHCKMIHLPLSWISFVPNSVAYP